MRAASYSRVSSQEQVDGLSLAAQRRGIAEYCVAKGWQPPHHYVDEGRSARSEAIEKRPALVSLLDACSAGQYDVVVVYSIDRWARNLTVTLETFGTLAKANVAFASVTESIDYTTPEGRLFVAMLGAFAQYFSDSLAKHTSKGVAERVHQGRPAGPIPFGYRRGDEGVPLRVEGEARAIAESFKMRSTGQTFTEIASWLNSRQFETRTGRPFTHFAVRDTLKNPFYAGQLRYRGQVLPGSHDAIVDTHLYERVQSLRVPRRGAPTHRDYLLRGLARCATCGGLLWCNLSRRGTTYYRQQGGHRECSVGEKVAPCDVIDREVEQIIASLKLEEDWRDTIVQRVVALSERDRISTEGRSAEQRLKRLGRAYVDGLIADRAYQAETRQLKERIASLVVPEVDIAMEAGALLEQVQDLWQEATLNERHDLLTGMLEAVYIDLPRRQVVGVTPRGPFRHAFTALSQQGSGLKLMPPEAVATESSTRPASGRCGGDGGESNPSSRGKPTRVSTGLAVS